MGDGPKAPRVDKSGRTSAGILLWRRRGKRLEVLLGHNGGPFFARKDLGHWTVLKGEVESGEDLVAVARREFAEETGHQLADGPLTELGQIRQRSGKVVLAWAVEGDLDPDTAVSNTYEMEWPPRSGRIQAFPEIDRVAWFDLPEARKRIKAAQAPFLDRLEASLATDPRPRTGQPGHSGNVAPRRQPEPGHGAWCARSRVSASRRWPPPVANRGIPRRNLSSRFPLVERAGDTLRACLDPEGT